MASVHGRGSGRDSSQGGGGPNNSLSLEELFIQQNMILGNGHVYDHHHQHQTRSAQDIVIRLQTPRPDVLRTRNEYVDVSRNLATGVDGTNRRRAAAAGRGHHESPTTATGRLLMSGGGNGQQQQRMVTTLGTPDDGGPLHLLSPTHRAHSMPLSPPSLPPSPVMAPVLLDGGNRSPPIVHRVNFDRTKAISSNNNVGTLYHPSTSAANQIGKPPLPVGRFVRMGSGGGKNQSPSSNVITSQPDSIVKPSSSSSRGLSDSCTDGIGATSGRRANGDCSSSSLMCKDCGRCRCSACTTPRTLPTRWICKNSYLVSNDSLVDALSCMCCLKGCLYHAGLDSTETDYYEERSDIDTNNCSTKLPAAASTSSASSTSSSNGARSSSSWWSSCGVGRGGNSRSDCCLRLGIMASALACLPCIWCYWPMRACSKGVESAYSRYHDHGCRCDRAGRAGGRRNEKKQQRQHRSAARSSSRGSTTGNRRLKRKRSHTLPPELPSITAAKAAAAVGSSCYHPHQEQRSQYS